MGDLLEEVVLRAGSAYAEGRYEEALRLYERAVLGHPNNAVLHANISAILLRLSRPEDSLAHAETSVSLQPRWGKAHYRKAEALRRLKETHRSLISYCCALRFEQPGKQVVHSMRECAKSVFLQSFPVEEMEKLSLHEDPFALLATVGQLLLSEGRLEEAILVLTWSLHLESPSLKLKASALACLGSAHYRSGDARRAIDYYEQQYETCKELGSGEATALRNIASAAEAAEEWELALRSRKKLILEPTLSHEEKNDERQSVGELLLQLDRGEEALLILEKSPGKNLRDKINLACAWAATGDGERALNALAPVRPANETLFSRAVEAVYRCFLAEGRLQEAVNYLEEVMDWTSSRTQNFVFKTACSLQCKVLLRMGNIASALRLAKRLLKMGRDQGDRDAEARALWLLAEAYEQQGDLSSALVLLQKYLSYTSKHGDKARTHLDIARIIGKKGMDPSEHLEKALNHVETFNDNKTKVQVNSVALRHFKGHGELLMAEELLQRQKTLLHCELDGTTRSLIFEDMAFMSAEEGGSSSTVTALEHSLAEAQEGNSVHRELELLELLGEELAKLGRRREAEGFFNRFLALAKQLRLASHIQRGHEKLAREFKLRGAWNLCADHARSALTVAKIQQDAVGRTEMLLLIGEAEMEREEWETAACVLKKGHGLAKAAQLDQLEATAHRLLSSFHAKRGGTVQEKRYLEKYVDLCSNPESALCEALLKLTREAGPAEAITLLRRCRRVSSQLKENEKILHLSSCFSLFLEMNLSDEAIHCLRLLPSPDLSFLRPLFSLPLPRQLPVLQFLQEHHLHSHSVHGRLLLLGLQEDCPLDPTCSLISAWKKNDYQMVLELNKEFIDCSVVSSEDMELMEAISNWHVNRLLPENLRDLTVQQQLRLHQVSWSSSAWQDVPSVQHRNRMLAGNFGNPLEEDHSLLEKIIASVVTGEDDLVPMWHQEMIDGLKEFNAFDGPERDVALAAIVIALAEDNPGEQLSLLESTKWELDRCLLGLHGLPAPPSPQLLDKEFSYVFGLDEVEFVWLWEDGRHRLYLSNMSPSPSFYIHLLCQFARRLGVQNLPPSPPCSQMIISNCRSSLPGMETRPWMRGRAGNTRSPRRIWLLSLTPFIIKGAVSCSNRTRSISLRKFIDCHVALVDSTSIPSVHQIISAGSAPDVVISTDRLSFPTYSALMLMGTSAIVELTADVSPTGVEVLVEQLRSGDPVQLCASHMAHWLLGDANFRIESDATMTRLRHIVREDPESFLVLARSCRQGGRLGEPWTAVARGLVTLTNDEISQLVPLLAEDDTPLINSVFQNPESTKFQALREKSIRDQFSLLYSDHLFIEDDTVEEPRTVRLPQPQRRSLPTVSLEDSGYVSDGEYLVAPRRQRTPGMNRSSATVISVHIPRYG